MVCLVVVARLLTFDHKKQLITDTTRLYLIHCFDYLHKMANNKVQSMFLHVRGSNPMSSFENLAKEVEKEKYVCQP